MGTPSVASSENRPSTTASATMTTSHVTDVSTTWSEMPCWRTVLAALVLTPKGSDNLARGNAPGKQLQSPPSLKGWDSSSDSPGAGSPAQARLPVAVLQTARLLPSRTRGVAPG